MLGVSRDSPESHRNFIEKQGLKVRLLSDPEHKVLDSYGAWQLKTLYGKQSWGTVRSTFLIDPQGKIAFVWPNVKVPGHADAVKQKLTETRFK